MRKYETVIVASPTIPDEEVGQIVSSYEQVIAGGGGRVILTDRWGRRRMAYRIARHEEGNYTLFSYEAPHEVVRELERRIRIDDRLIRYMTVLVDWEKKVARAELARASARPRRRPAERADEDASGDREEEAGGDEASAAS